MPDWLLYIWLAITVLMSFLGQGSLSFLLIRYVHSKWFALPDNRDQHIALLNERIADLTKVRDNQTIENGKLINMIVELVVKQA